MIKKKNISLIIGLSIPVGMVVLIGVSIYLPSLFIKPATNFLYAYGGDYYTQQRYTVRKEKLVEVEVKYPENQLPMYKKEESQLFVYDVKTDRVEEISFEEAKLLTLDRYHKSADGFQVVSGGSGGGFLGLFYDSHHGEHYLKKNAYSKRLEIDPNQGRQRYAYFRFLGWVKE